MVRYSIKDLEHLSGVKAHTLRIWEQRYDFLKPHRTDTNIRYYDQQHLSLLLRMGVLTQYGHRISNLANVTEQELSELLEVLYKKESYSIALALDKLKIAMLELNNDDFERILENHSLTSGFDNCMKNLVLPFLDMLFEYWELKSIYPIHESFVSNIIRQKIIAQIDRLPNPSSNAAAKFIVFAPEGEHQELILLLMHYFIKYKGHKVVYLGVDAVQDQVILAQNIHKASHVCFMLMQEIGLNVLQSYINGYLTACENAKIWVTGIPPLDELLSLSPRLYIPQSMEHFIAALDFDA